MVRSKNYAPVRINQGQQNELVDVFSILPEEKQNIMRITLDILGWDVINSRSNRSGFKLERQS